MAQKGFGISGILVGLALALLWGCSETPAPVLPHSPQRIITMAPSIAEMVFALGAGNRVVGVSDFCNYPPEAKEKPHCGGYMNPNYETLRALKPDLVIIQGVFQEMRDFCAQRKIPLLDVDMDSISTIVQGARTIGQAIGASEEAEKLVARIEEAARQGPEPQSAETPGVLLVIGRVVGDLGSVSTVGGISFLSEVTTIAGGRNIFEDIRDPYPQVSLETVLVRKPDVILEFRAGEELTEDAKQKIIADWSRMESLPAVQKGRVYVITEDYALLPGPRVTLLIDLLRGILYPGKVNEEKRNAGR